MLMKILGSGRSWFLSETVEGALIGSTTLLLTSALLVLRGGLWKDDVPFGLLIGLVLGGITGACISPLLKRFPIRPGLLQGAIRGLVVGAVLGTLLSGAVASVIGPMRWSTDVWLLPPLACIVGAQYGLPVGAVSGLFVGTILGSLSAWWHHQPIFRFNYPAVEYAARRSHSSLTFAGIALFGLHFAALAWLVSWLVQPDVGERLYSYRRIQDYSISPDGSRIALLVADIGPMIPSGDFEGVHLAVLDGETHDVLYLADLPGQGFTVQWVEDSDSVLILGDDTQRTRSMLRWDTGTDISVLREFPYSGFSVSRDQRKLAAWTWQHSGLDIFTLPDLVKIDSIPIPNQSGLEAVMWSADDSALMVLARTGRIGKYDLIEINFRPRQFNLVLEQAPSFGHGISWQSNDGTLVWEKGPTLYLYDINQRCMVARQHFKRNVRRPTYRGLEDELLLIRQVVGEDEDSLFRLDSADLALSEQKPCLSD